MKMTAIHSTFLALLFLLIAVPLSAQKDFTRSRVITRIDLAEKANRSAEKAPHVLLNEWRMGKIKGYYPNVIDAPLSWAAFAQKFRISPNEMDFDATDFPCCDAGPEQEKREQEWLENYEYPGFGAVLELIEDKRTTGRTSVTQYDTRYIRLVWVDPQEGLPDRNGVVFSLAEVAHLLESVHTAHPRNEAATLSLHTVIKNREFTGYMINVSGRGILTLAEAQKRANQFTEKEENLNRQ